MKRPPSKKTTLNDVALAAGVTKATVSLVLSGKGSISPGTRQAVRRIARSLNYEPNPHAQRLSSGRCMNTVALFSFNMDLGVGTVKLQLMQRLLLDQGYEIPAYAYSYFSPQEEERQFQLMKSLCRQNPRVIILDVQGLYDHTLAEVRRYIDGGGVVIGYDHYTDLPIDRVIFDREDNTYQATRHLLELGHRDIGFSEPGSPFLSGVRVDGFVRAMREFGVEPQEHWMFGSEPEGFAHGLYEEAGVDLAKRIVSLKKAPTGLVTLDDATAGACAAELARAGWRVPEDISIVGHDDRPIARYGALPLTTVSQPVEAISRHVVELLTSRLMNPELPVREIVLQGELIVRESTAAPSR